MLKKIVWLTIICAEALVILLLVKEALYLGKIPSQEKLTAALVNNSENNTPVYPADFTEPSDNPKLAFELKPNYSQKFDGYNDRLPIVTTVNINSDGFRDKEYSVEKQPNTFRIIVLGDSVAFGWGVENNEPYSEILEKNLNSLNNGINYEVLNFGVWGYGTIQEVEILKTRGLKYNPDMVILGYHGSDISDNVEIVATIEKNIYYDKLKNIQRQILDQNNVSNLSEIASHEKKKEISLDIINKFKRYIRSHPFKEVWGYTRNALEELRDISIKQSISIVNVTFLTPPLYQEEQTNTFNEFSDKNGQHIIPGDTSLLKYPEKMVYVYVKESNFPGMKEVRVIDGHPNVFGHQLIGGDIFRFLLDNALIPTSLNDMKKNVE